MKLQDVVCFFAAAFFLCMGPSRAGQYVCEGVALRDLHALEDPTVTVRQGERVVDIVRYEIDKKTGEDRYCAGRYCYQAHDIVDFVNVETIHLANCRIGGPVPLRDLDSPTKDYLVELLVAGDPSKALSLTEVDMRLDRMGLCRICVGNAGVSYARDPLSQCGQLVGKALAGDVLAKKTLAKNFPDYCWVPDSQPPTVGPNAREAAPFAGRYEGGAGRYGQELEITKLPDGSFEVSINVGTQGCAGSIDARGAADGDRLKAQESDDNRTCLLDLRRTKNGVSVDEGENCFYFHGPSCDFSGAYRVKLHRTWTPRQTR